MQPDILLKALLMDERARVMDPYIDDRVSDDPYRSAIGYLLGHCGNKGHAVILRKLIDDQTRNGKSYGALQGYVLLEPEAGWNYTVNLLEQKEKTFLVRYTALRVIRFVAEKRTDIAEMKKCAEALTRGLKSPDLADFVIEDFRRWKCWEYCDTILQIHHKPGYDTAIMRKAILRFALQCPAPHAKAFVQAERNVNREWVEEVEELLALELPNPPKK